MELNIQLLSSSKCKCEIGIRDNSKYVDEASTGV